MIKIICIGKLKEKYWVEATEEYLKRIKKYTTIQIIELPDEGMEDAVVALRKEKEKIEKVLNEKDFFITLEIEGKEYTSTQLATKIDQLYFTHSNLTFLIGGSYGIAKELKQRSNLKLSFSPLTFPHQLFRVMLLEQIYRSYKIVNNEKYHK